MYRQVLIDESQRNLQRIIWRENPQLPIKHFVLNTVTYGTAPASFLAIRSLQQAANDKRNQFREASQVILDDFYVDDLITGADTTQNARKLKAEVDDILRQSCFHLTQWMSNDISILDIDEKQKMASQCIFDNNSVKTLGMLWDPHSDKLLYSVDINYKANKITKRSILSIISQIFDPLGLICPLVTHSKLILQRLWKLKIDWDDYIPDQLSLEFSKSVNDLKNLKAVSIPRHVLLPSSNLIIELHGFADASQFAYGACVYLRCSNNQNEVKTSMLSAKSRVAPLKSQTIPRLELCGALLLSRLIDKIMKNIKLDINQVILYSDSTIVLAWLAREPAELKTFVSNRVSEILELTSKYKWQHVLSNDNPADIITRGCKTTDLANNSLWLLGPPWLSNDHLLERQYPEMSEINEIPELKGITHLHISTEIIELDIFSRFSSFNKLLHVTAFCMRFIENCKSPKPNRNLNKSLLIPEIEDATVRLIRLIQSQLLYDDIDHLKRFNCLPKKSKIRCLHPFIDENQILRVGGRLRHSEIPFNHKFPILLPSNHAFVTLLIRYEHSKTLHGGVQTVLSSIRLQYWIINGKNVKF
nr:unnamed protein product [Callosobruchus analis]